MMAFDIIASLGRLGAASRWRETIIRRRRTPAPESERSPARAGFCFEKIKTLWPRLTLLRFLVLDALKLVREGALKRCG